MQLGSEQLPAWIIILECRARSELDSWIHCQLCIGWIQLWIHQKNMGCDCFCAPEHEEKREKQQNQENQEKKEKRRATDKKQRTKTGKRDEREIQNWVEKKANLLLLFTGLLLLVLSAHVFLLKPELNPAYTSGFTNPTPNANWEDFGSVLVLRPQKIQ